MHRWLVEHGWVNDSNGSAAGRALSYVAFLSVGFLPLALYLFILTVVVTWGDLLEAYANGYLFSFLWAMPSFQLGRHLSGHRPRSDCRRSAGVAGRAVAQSRLTPGAYASPASYPLTRRPELAAGLLLAPGLIRAQAFLRNRGLLRWFVASRRRIAEDGG